METKADFCKKLKKFSKQRELFQMKTAKFCVTALVYAWFAVAKDILLRWKGLFSFKDLKQPFFEPNYIIIIYCSFMFKAHDFIAIVVFNIVHKPLKVRYTKYARLYVRASAEKETAGTKKVMEGRI